MLLPLPVRSSAVQCWQPMEDDRPMSTSLDPHTLVARIIDELNQNPDVKPLLLRAILTDEFLLLPAKVDRLMDLPAKVEQLQQDVGQLRQDVGQLQQDVGQLRQDVGQLQQDMTGVRDDLRPLKGFHARVAAERAIRRIARLVNCRLVRQLNDDDLYDMLVQNDTADLDPNALKSFENADLIIEARHRESGALHYIAVEASFTGHKNDTDRASRNAGYLERFTGQPAHAVVASLRLTDEVRAIIDQGAVTWCELERRHLEAD